MCFLEMHSCRAGQERSSATCVALLFLHPSVTSGNPVKSATESLGWVQRSRLSSQGDGCALATLFLSASSVFASRLINVPAHLVWEDLSCLAFPA